MKTNRAQSEESLLRHELAESRRALSENAGAVRIALVDAVNPVTWARVHPWLTAAAATAAGYVVAKKVFGPETPHSDPPETSTQPLRSDGRTWKRSAFNALKTALTESLALYSQMKLAGLAARESVAPNTTAGSDPDRAGYADDMEDAAAYTGDSASG
jgi:hypothetical protein